MVQIAVFDKNWADEDGAERLDFRDPIQFLQREIHILQW